MKTKGLQTLTGIVSSYEFPDLFKNLEAVMYNLNQQSSKFKGDLLNLIFGRVQVILSTTVQDLHHFATKDLHLTSTLCKLHETS